MGKKLEVKFSRHTVEKLKDSTSKKLGITIDLIKDALDKPELIDNDEYPVLMAIKQLNKTLSFCVIYKFIDMSLRVITFFPARRGRYENKILSGR